MLELKKKAYGANIVQYLLVLVGALNGDLELTCKNSFHGLEAYSL